MAREIRRCLREVRYPSFPVRLIVWVLIGALSYGRHYLIDAPAESPARIAFGFLLWLTCFLPWPALAPLIFRLEGRYPLGNDDWPKSIAVLAAAGIPLAYIAAEMALALGLVVQFALVQPLSISSPWWRPSLQDLTVMTLSYWFTVVAGYVIRNLHELHEREREAATLALEKSQLESSLHQAELETLRTRLNPHFLFNCLQNIAALTEEDPKAASQMLARLGDLLRAALRSDGGPEIPLASEIALTKTYVNVEAVRFGDRLSVFFDIDAQTDRALVPTFLLQPLVENAILHGLQGVQRTGVISVRSQVKGDDLLLVVTDNGVGLATKTSEDLNIGIGLDSTCKRLARMYPERHTFSLRPLPEGGTEVAILLPLHFRHLDDGALASEESSLVDR